MSSGSLDKAIRWLLYAALATPLIAWSGVIFPFTSVKGWFFMTAVELALIVTALQIWKSDFQIWGRHARSSGLWLITAFAAVYLIAGFLGVDPGASFWSTPERMDGTLILLHVVAFVWLCVRFFERMHWQIAFRVTAIVGSLIVLHIAGQLLKILPNFSGEVARFSGVMGNPIFLAAYLLFTLTSGLWMWFQEQRAWRWIGFVAAMLAVFGIVQSSTRGAAVGLAAGGIIGLGYWLYAQRRELKQRWSFILIGLVLAAGVAGAVLTVPAVREWPPVKRLMSISLESGTAKSRLLAAEMGLKAFILRPILGYGPETYSFIYATYFNPQILTYDLDWFDKAHNKLVEVALSGGGVALVLYLVLFGWLIKAIIRLKAASPAARAVLVGGSIAYFVQNVFGFDTISSQVGFAAMYGYVASQMVSVGQLSEPAYARPRDSIWPRATAIVVAVVALAGFVVGVRQPLTAAREARAAFELEARGAPALLIMDKYFDGLKQATYVDQHLLLNAISYAGRHNAVIQGKDRAYVSRELYKYMQRFMRAHPNNLRLAMAEGSLFALYSDINPAWCKEAEQIFDMVKARAPQRPEPYYELGLFLKNRGDFDAMIKTYETGVALNPDVGRSHWVLGSGYFLYARDLVNNGDLQRAQVMYEKADQELRAGVERGIGGFDISTWQILRDVSVALKNYENIVKYELEIIELQIAALTNVQRALAAAQRRDNGSEVTRLKRLEARVKAEVSEEYGSLAAAYAALKDCPKLAQAGQKAVEFNPDAQTEFSQFLNENCGVNME